MKSERKKRKGVRFIVDSNGEMTVRMREIVQVRRGRGKRVKVN